MNKKIKRKIWDLILVQDKKKGTLKLIPFPRNDPAIWDKIKKKKIKKTYLKILKGGRI